MKAALHLCTRTSIVVQLPAARTTGNPKDLPTLWNTTRVLLRRTAQEDRPEALTERRPRGSTTQKYSRAKRKYMRQLRPQLVVHRARTSQAPKTLHCRNSWTEHSWHGKISDGKQAVARASSWSQGGSPLGSSDSVSVTLEVMCPQVSENSTRLVPMSDSQSQQWVIASIEQHRVVSGVTARDLGKGTVDLSAISCESTIVSKKKKSWKSWLQKLKGTLKTDPKIRSNTWLFLYLFHSHQGSE